MATIDRFKLMAVARDALGEVIVKQTLLDRATRRWEELSKDLTLAEVRTIKRHTYKALGKDLPSEQEATL